MRLILLLVPLLISGAGCRRAPAPPQPAEPSIRLLSAYPPGTPFSELVAAMRLDAVEVRQRGGLPVGRKSAVYFFQDGDLHVDTVEREGVWQISAVPFIEDKKEPAADRVKKWDAAAERKEFEQNPLKGKR